MRDPLLAGDDLGLFARLVLELYKYGPDESSRWKGVNARFPTLYKALLAELDRATRVARLKQAVRLTG